MLIMVAYIGDMLMTLTAVEKLRNPDDERDGHKLIYQLGITDTSGEMLHASAEFTGENEAVRAFCAVVASDEPDLTNDVDNLNGTDIEKFMA